MSDHVISIVILKSSPFVILHSCHLVSLAVCQFFRLSAFQFAHLVSYLDQSCSEFPSFRCVHFGETFCWRTFGGWLIYKFKPPISVTVPTNQVCWSQRCLLRNPKIKNLLEARLDSNWKNLRVTKNNFHLRVKSYHQHHVLIHLFHCYYPSEPKTSPAESLFICL